MKEFFRRNLVPLLQVQMKSILVQVKVTPVQTKVESDKTPIVASQKGQVRQPRM